MKAAVFSCKGLGDGLISLALANNLYINDYQVDLFHDDLGEMQSFFEHLIIKKYPEIYHIDQILLSYDRVFISYDASNKFIMELIKKGKENFSDRVFVLNPCPSKKIGQQPFYKDALFEADLCMVDNINFFCKKILKLKKVSKKIDLNFPKGKEFKKNKNRVIIHPSSAKKSKNWTLEKYIKLAKLLKNKNFEVIFIVRNDEKKEFIKVQLEGGNLKTFNNLKDLTLFIYESSYMIGNDSGLGHLSSLIGLPTISIFRNCRSAKLWRPGWNKNKIIYPNRLIPNLSIYRLRDKYWKKFIFTKKILNEFLKI
jgi:ADP-heptose:LPS heptosyltransferase